MRIAASSVVIAVLVLSSSAFGASAATAVRLGEIDSSAYPTVRLAAVTPTPLARAPVLRENGEPVVGFAAENLARAKSVVLAIDRSQSMDGDPLADASRAARDFVAHKPPDDRIAVVAVGSQAVRLTSFSSATIDVDAGLRSIEIDGTYGTALWDSVVLSSRMLAAEDRPARVLILLTDGQEISSKSSLERAISVARHAGVSVYVIGIESARFQPQPLERLAAATGGTYFAAATTDALQAVYSTIADQLRRTWRLTYLTVARPGESVELTAAVPGFARTTLRTTMPGNPATAAVERRQPSPLFPSFLYQHNIGTFLLALLVGSCTIIVTGLCVATPRSTRLRRRLDPHTHATRKRRGRSAPRERFAAASGILAATEKSLAHLRFWKGMHRLIERGDLPLRTVEFFYTCVGAALLLGLLTAVVAAPTIVTVGAIALGGLAPVLYASFRARRRLGAIEEQLPDLLITIAASLKAGHSFRQALQAVVDEGQPPAADEFKRVLTETSLGRPMDDALNEMSERVGSKNLDFVITAVTIQRQVGGSLAGIFDMVADSVRQRQQFVRKVKGLTAMGRMAAYVLIGLPFFLAFMFTIINPDYMRPLWESPAGQKIVVAGLVMLGLGSAVLRKMVAFRG